MDDNEKLTTEEQALLDEMAAAEDPAPDEQVEAAPEEQPEAEGQQPERPKMVDQRALVEERERRREIERQYAEDKRRWEERFNQVLQRVGQPAQPQPEQTAQKPPIPDRTTDPVGYLEAQAAEAKAEAAAVRQELAQRRQVEDQARIVSTIQQHAVVAEQQFRSTTPDYDAAVAHLRGVRDKELELAGVSNPMERHHLMAQEALAVSARALQDNRNPAEVIYNIAKVRGYAPQPAQQPGERLQNINRGQQQSRASLGNVRGSGPTGLNINTVLDMDDAAFGKWLEKATPEQKRSVMGA